MWTRLEQVRRWALACVTVTVLVTAAGCGGDDPELPGPPEPPPESAASPSPTPGLDLTPEEQAAVDEALEVFDAYISTYVRLATEGTDFTEASHYGELGQYGIGSPDGYEVVDLDNNQVQGRLGSGTIEWKLLEVLAVDLAGDESPNGDPTVRFRVCIDETGWTLVDEDTDEVVEGPGSRHVATILTFYAGDEYDEIRPEEAWRIGLWENEEDGRSC